MNRTSSKASRNPGQGAEVPSGVLGNAMKLDQNHSFIPRHIGPDEKAQKEMLSVLGLQSLDELIDKALPQNIRLRQPLDLPDGMSEAKLLETAWKLASKNQVFRSYIGNGYFDCLTPSVV